MSEPPVSEQRLKEILDAVYITGNIGHSTAIVWLKESLVLTAYWRGIAERLEEALGSRVCDKTVEYVNLSMSRKEYDELMEGKP